ncbi:MAG TPA: NADH-quinone oxidoreductase subunit N, partial [Geobacteraceae bacterium]
FIVVGVLTFLVSENYLRDERMEHGEYHALVLLALVGMMFMASATHLLMFFVALETMSIAIYALAGYLRTKEGVESSFKYFLLGGFSSAFFLYGTALVYGATGTTQIHELARFFHEQAEVARSPMLLTGIALLLVGFGFKIAAFPFHVWTPDVYQGAPTSVTAFMATGVKAAAFAALFRVFVTAFPAASPVWGQMLWILSVATMTMGNFAALAQMDVKRMLAYSSIAHAGYLLVGVVTGTAEAGTGVLFYLLTYAFMNIGAFSCVIMIGRRGNDATSLDDYAGLGFKFPFLSAALCIFMLSMAGIPPTAGFIGKFLVFKAAVNEGYYWLTILGVLNSAASVYYYLRVIVYLYFRERPEGAPATGLRTSATSNLATAFAVAAILLLGVMPGAVMELAAAAAASMF